jgi:hypothetical protein
MSLEKSPYTPHFAIFTIKPNFSDPSSSIHLPGPNQASNTHQPTDRTHTTQQQERRTVMEKTKLQYDMLKGVARKLMALRPDNDWMRSGHWYLTLSQLMTGDRLMGTPHLNFMVSAFIAGAGALIHWLLISVHLQSLQECHGGAVRQDVWCLARWRSGPVPHEACGRWRRIYLSRISSSLL